MGTPPFITNLRKHVGHAHLWVPGVTAVVLNDAHLPTLTSTAHSTSPVASKGDTSSLAPEFRGADSLEVLLVRRFDNGQWTPVTGIVDPGEDAHTAAIREVLEETGLAAEVHGILGTSAVGPVTYPNGDTCSFQDVAFRLGVSDPNAVPKVGDDESTNVAWFEINSVPDMTPRFHALIEAAAQQLLAPECFTPLLGYGSSDAIEVDKSY